MVNISAMKVSAVMLAGTAAAQKSCCAVQYPGNQNQKKNAHERAKRATEGQIEGRFRWKKNCFKRRRSAMRLCGFALSSGRSL
jgi:hypothetical protein